MTDHKHPNRRFIIALTAGLAVTLISTVVAWQQFGFLPAGRAQMRTRDGLAEFARAISAHQQQTGELPATLEDLDDDSYDLWYKDDLLDGWQRPFVYTTDGTDFTLTSLGRDGKPGGVGIDRDLTHLAPRPPGSEITFFQFIFDDRTKRIAASCLVSGLLTFFISFHFAKQIVRTREQKNALCSKIVVTIIGALIMSAILATFYAMQAWGGH